MFSEHIKVLVTALVLLREHRSRNLFFAVRVSTNQLQMLVLSLISDGLLSSRRSLIIRGVVLLDNHAA